MKRLHLLLALCSIFGYAFADTDDVSNVTAYQEGQNIIIEYDLAKPNDVTPYVSINGGTDVQLTNVTGDVGASVSAGHKRIVWDVLYQYENFAFGSVKFRIKTGITSVTDICGNVYPVVKIGNQYWLAENYRCSLYDTESESYKEKRYVVLKTNSEASDEMTPGYTDASDKNVWDVTNQTIFDVSLSEKQINKLGYLYNWAAVVGVANGIQVESTYHDNNRQGICPNDWHVPSYQEWNTLMQCVGGSDIAGNHLKSKIGWRDNGNGQDSKHFSALPAGYSYGSIVFYIGDTAWFWSSTYDEQWISNANSKWITYDKDELYDGELTKNKDSKRSVRCVWNNP